MTSTKPWSLAFVTTHPIQYHAPLFREMARHPNLALEVLYCHHASAVEQGAAGFGVAFDWDVELMNGYRYRFLRNVAKRPSGLSFFGVDTPEISTVLEQNKYDAVLISGWHYKGAWQTMRACWNRNIPVMIRSDSHLNTQRHPLKRLLKTLPYRWLMSKLDAYLAVGTWSTDYFVHYGARPERVFLVPHAVSYAFQESAESLRPRRTELRRQWGLKEDDVIFLFVGKFIEKKRPLDFIRAIGRAHGRAERIVGLMVGDGPLRRDCERMVSESQLPVRFAGFLNQSEIANSYTAADVLVLPSDGGETWGVVVNEAMSCGLPCLVSDQVGCGPDLVLPGETGFIFPLGAVDTLASRMVDFAMCPDLITSAGGKARQHLARYSMSAAVDGVLAALAYIVPRG